MGVVHGPIDACNRSLVRIGLSDEGVVLSFVDVEICIVRADG